MKDSDLPGKIKKKKDLLCEWWTSPDTLDRGKYGVISQSSFNTAWLSGKISMYLPPHRNTWYCNTVQGQRKFCITLSRSGMGGMLRWSNGKIFSMRKTFTGCWRVQQLAIGRLGQRTSTYDNYFSYALTDRGYSDSWICGATEVRE